MLLVVISICFVIFIAKKNKLETSSNCNASPIEVIIGDKSYRLERAVTVAEQTLGLGGRLKLGAQEGMIFVFDNSITRTFWMKDMNFPIDIIWVNEDDEVVGVERGASPDSYPKVFTSPPFVNLVIEINPQSAEIPLGTKIIFKCKK